MKNKVVIKESVEVDENNIEVIKWKDAQSEDGWSSERTAELATVITVGFLIKENKEAVCIASTWADPDSNCKLHIPKSWIKERKTLCINKVKRAYKTRKKFKSIKTNASASNQDVLHDQYNRYYGA
tara:strand:- start:135 stop:512 length:378 start_codon:yes stop_codon:yes gene_type:complete